MRPVAKFIIRWGTHIATIPNPVERERALQRAPSEYRNWIESVVKRKLEAA